MEASTLGPAPALDDLCYQLLGDVVQSVSLLWLTDK